MRIVQYDKRNGIGIGIVVRATTSRTSSVILQITKPSSSITEVSQNDVRGSHEPRSGECARARQRPA